MREDYIDDISITNFATIMKEKMKVSREKGRVGWHDPEKVTDEYISELFWNHINKTNSGNFVDLANFLMMLHVRKAPNDILMRTVERKE